MTRLLRSAVFLAMAALLAPRAAPAQASTSEFAKRRQKLMNQLGDGMLVITGAEEPKEDYLNFWQSPDFDYLTGFHEPGAKMIVVKQGASQVEFLFSEDKNPAREVWTGNRAGAAKAGAQTATIGRSVAEFQRVLDSVATRASKAFLANGDTVVAAALVKKNPGLTVSDAGRALQQLRGTKTPEELACIRRAVDVTVDAQKLAMRAVRPDAGEYEVQGLIEYTFRRNGADRPSFGTIVGSGPNSTTLHYGENSRTMKAGEVVVMDIGASFKGYAADVTRTVPVTGTYSPAQRDIYQIVRDAQAAAEKEAVIGAPARNMSVAASKTLAEGLARVGLITSADGTYDCGNGRTCSQLGLYYMHGLGHGIGLEVHDPDQYYFTGTLAAGSAFTIEPGIYVRENLLEILPDSPVNKALIASIKGAHARYKNIGVRIEDDYIVTASGVEWISRAPREMAEIEALMKQGPAMLNTAQAPMDLACGAGRVQP